MICSVSNIKRKQLDYEISYGATQCDEASVIFVKGKIVEGVTQIDSILIHFRFSATTRHGEPVNKRH